MDDTQDKVRRNLVVFCAAIIVGWFLDLKLTSTGQRHDFYSLEWPRLDHNTRIYSCHIVFKECCRPHCADDIGGFRGSDHDK